MVSKTVIYPYPYEKMKFQKTLGIGIYYKIWAYVVF
jgi:hypothetical protein